MDTTTKLRQLLVNLEEITKCAVCLENVGTNVVQCMTGHGICSRCRRQILMCPTCGEFFLGSKPTMLVQVLEALPKLCQFSEQGCKEISFSGNHELCCEYRTIKCNIGNYCGCQWVGLVKDFRSHAQGYHNNFFTSYMSGYQRKLYYKKFADNWHTQHYLHIVDSQIFLLFAHKDQVNKRFIQVVKHIPIGEPIDTYYFIVTFARQNIIFRHSIKASLYINEKERHENSPYCMIVPIEELDSLINPNTGSLEVMFEAVKN